MGALSINGDCAMQTLDGAELKLQATDLVIADAQKAVALAGIMGGEHSGCTDDTTDVLLEIAYFTPERIARTGQALAGAEDADPLKIELYKRAQVVEKVVPRLLWCCASCGAEGVQERHRCADKTLTPAMEKREVYVKRWYWLEPFNPDSPPQVLAYMKHKRHKPGKNKKTKKESSDRETLMRLRASTKDPFYAVLLELRALGKVRGTYAIGIRKRLDAQSRFHPTFTLRPSTLEAAQKT